VNDLTTPGTGQSNRAPAAVGLTELPAVDGRTVSCPAATLLASELRRRGVPVLTGPPTGLEPGVVFVATVAGDQGRAAGLGVAVLTRTPGRESTASQAFADGLAVNGPRTVLLSSPRSFCAGVKRAIEIVRRLLGDRGGPVYVRKQIVHNVHVVAELAALGAVFVEGLAAVPVGASVVFSAHGVFPVVRKQAVARGLDVIDATCPLAAKMHAEARRFAAHGDMVVLIGHPGHEEIEGTLGEAPIATVLVEDAADVAALRVDEPSKVVCLTQTALDLDETTEVIAVLRERFPRLRQPRNDDICYASTNRQQSLIDDVSDIRPDWLSSARVIGLTAGASTPERLVDEDIAALRGVGPIEVCDRETTREATRFDLPIAVRTAG
jgi:4-hydroxy-3-methylbut-2-enyl diphosphate reductase